MNRKIERDFVVKENIRLSDNYVRLVLAESGDDECGYASRGSVVRNRCLEMNHIGGTSINQEFDYSGILPGQFVEVRIDGSKSTFLRRPISINYVVPELREIHLLVRKAGAGTDALCRIENGDFLNVILPLGNGFSLDLPIGSRPLLVGGGVGVAPLLYLGKMLKDNGILPAFLLAAKSDKDLLEVDRFREYGEVLLSTDDGSAGHCGLVTENPALQMDWDMVYCCGPMPMMRAVGRIAMARGIACEVSLENVMACGLGACLCCVEDTVDGHVCVCKEGPVFDVRRLKW